jgi:hypothetical protein
MGTYENGGLVVASLMADRRPRILDFGGRPQEARTTSLLGWPCRAYRVVVPVRGRKLLNVFEETVLRLLENSVLDEEQLADLTCLDLSLARLVCARLRDAGLITAGNDIAPAGKSYLRETDAGNSDYEVRWLFREAVSGKILPVLCDGDLRYEELVEWRRGKAVIAQSDRVRRVRLLPGDQAGHAAAPPPADVLRVVKRHGALCRQFAVLGGGVPIAPKVIGNAPMTIDPSPEEVYLCCFIFIPRNADDYRIADPFGFGLSDILFSAFEALRAKDPMAQEFLQRLRDRATTVRPDRLVGDDDGSAARSGLAVREIFGEAIHDFPGLFRALKDVERNHRNSDKCPKGQDQLQHQRKFLKGMAISLAEAMEEAMAAVVAGSRSPACEELLASSVQTPDGNRELLEAIAGRLGFQTGDDSGFLRVLPGRVRSLREGQKDLQALAAVCLVAADEAVEHPLRKLVSEFGNWLSFMARLKAARDPAYHGDVSAAVKPELDWLRTQMHRAVKLLLPQLGSASTGDLSELDLSTLGDIHDKRRAAKSALERAFGVQRMSILESEVAELLVQIELSSADLFRAKEDDRVNAARVIVDLASVLQMLIHEVLSAHCPGADPTPDVAENRARGSGLLADNAVLPEALARVNARRLREANQGLSPSLGANLMVLLVLAPIEVLRGLAEAAPNLLAVCARLLELRGHGNCPVLMRPHAVATLKREAYEVCIALMEA